MTRTPQLDETFGAEYDRFPVKGLTRDEYIAKRYQLAHAMAPTPRPRQNCLIFRAL